MRGTPGTSRTTPAADVISPQSTGWVELVSSHSHWTIHTPLASTLYDGVGLRWSEWRSHRQLHLVKQGPHRAVYRLTLAAGEFYLKHYRVPDWKALARNILKGSPAWREWQAARRIAELGLPTFEPVALGLSRRAGLPWDGFLVSRAIPDALPLDHYLLTEFAALPAPRQAFLRQSLARQLAELAARLHAGGVEHVDLHAGNILIRTTPDGEPALSLIDLHSAQLRRRLSPSRRRKNLADLHQFFAGRSTRADRLRFFSGYLTALHFQQPADADSAPDKREFRPQADLLERLLQDAALAGWRRADRAWNRGNRHVRRLTTAQARCRSLATFDASWLQDLAATPEDLFARRLVRWCKLGRSCRVAQVLVPCGDDTLYGYWKALDETAWLASFQTIFRQSASRRAWEIGHALLRRGIDTPRPLAVVERPWDSPPRHYLLTAAIDDSTTAERFLKSELSQLAPAAQAEWVLTRSRRIARQLRRLHASGFDHRDLKFSNLLVSRDAAVSRVWLLDLDHVRVWRRLPQRRAVQNLSRLAVSARQHPSIRASQRVRFLKFYLGESFDSEWKDWWRAIARRLSLKLARNQSRGRPVS
ncbi:MAG: lipopolysaccharide kinase InaA family protein [Planctomycetaceae bacterium]